MQKMANVKSERDRDTLNSETPARYFRDGRIKNPKSCRICKTSDFLDGQRSSFSAGHREERLRRRSTSCCLRSQISFGSQ